jgi:PAS domain S-box-containing protein/putative nucleotidyltransferase with HDIG domain
MNAFSTEPVLNRTLVIGQNRLKAMGHVSHAVEPQSLYELSWTYAPGSMFALDCGTGQLINANPAAEALSGYSRDELIGMSLIDLHPEIERERVELEIQNAIQKPSRWPSGFHLMRKDGQCVPVMISSSKSLVLAGQTVVNFVYRDIIELVEREHQLSVKNWALSAFSAAALALGRAQSAEGLLQSICEAITRESLYALAWVGIAEDSPDKKVRFAGAAGSAVGYLDGLQVSWSEDDAMGRGPTGICLRTGKVTIIEDSEVSKFFSPWREHARQFGIRSTVAIPFSIDGDRRGALMVYSAQPNAFEPEAIEVFENLAREFVYGLQALEQKKLLQVERRSLAKTQEQLRDALSAMVAPIVTAMEMRDPYTTGHQGRVAEIACSIGREMGWSEERLQGLRVAALVHDIGKITIPAEILTKPGKLNPAEREMIKGHSETGYAILKEIPFAWPVAEIVRQHHEKLDGSGYPLGLKADAILPEAKVLAVADIVEAMASYRPYRQEIHMDVVLEQIQKEAGGLLDPEIVRVCVALFRQKNFVVQGWNRH